MALATLLTLSCGTMPPAHDDDHDAGAAPRYSLVFIIHGDGNYLYHDTSGNARSADEEVLASAQAVAAQSPNSEVFIFHEIKRRHLLFLIPRRDGRAYHYRGGRLLAQKSYWRDQGDSHLAPEVRLHGQFIGSRAHAPLRLLLYFGHELPEFNGAGYDSSYPERQVTIHDLAGGIKDIAGAFGKIDLLVLATCFGGTPHSISALAPYARYIVASPDNLHLSYFDLSPLAALDIGPGDDDVAAFADHFAHNAFERLVSDVQTAVSVVVYDVNDTRTYRDSVVDAYDRVLVTANGASAPSAEHCDCASDSSYSRPAMSNGLTVFYRAPRFGRARDTQRHSGWECWRFAE